jgi:hypothetical protein
LTPRWWGQGFNRAQIAEIEIYETIISEGVKLTWTAPGDDDLNGTASSYDVRCSTTAIVTLADYDAAKLVAGEPIPQPAGSAESMVVSSVPQGETLYFSLRTSDDSANLSDLSNVATFQTPSPDTTPPSTVADLAASLDTPTVLLTAPAISASGEVGSKPKENATDADAGSYWSSPLGVDDAGMSGSPWIRAPLTIFRKCACYLARRAHYFPKTFASREARTMSRSQR